MFNFETSDRTDDVWHTDFKLKDLNYWTGLKYRLKGIGGHLPVPFGIKEAEERINATGATVEHKYSHRLFVGYEFGHTWFSLFPTSWDYVVRAPYPDLYTGDDFTKQKYYYYGLFHELTHWTGTKERLNRKPFYGYKDKDYAYACEEIVATLGLNEHLKDFGLYDAEMEARAYAYLSGYLNKAIDGLIRMKKVIYNPDWAATEYYELPVVKELMYDLTKLALESYHYIKSFKK